MPTLWDTGPGYAAGGRLLTGGGRGPVGPPVRPPSPLPPGLGKRRDEIIQIKPPAPQTVQGPSSLQTIAGPGQVAGLGQASTSTDPIYAAIVAAASGMHPEQQWTGENADKLLAMSEAARKMWGEDRVLQYLKGDPWMQLYALRIAQSGLGLGKPVYNKTGAGDLANLVYVPGFMPPGYPGQIQTEGYSGGGYVY